MGRVSNIHKGVGGNCGFGVGGRALVPPLALMYDYDNFKRERFLMSQVPY